MQEPLLVSGRLVFGADRLSRTVRWCHSLDDIVRDRRVDLEETVVLADSGEIADRWSAIAASNCAAVFVRGPFPADVGDIGDHVVVEFPRDVSRTRILELIAEVTLAHRAHVLQYGQQVHSVLAHLLHRGAGLTAMCTRLARLSRTSVAALGVDLHLLAFDPGPGDALDPPSVVAAIRDHEASILQMCDEASGGHAIAQLELRVKDRTATCLIAPIDLVEQRDGWMLLIDSAPDRTDHDLAAHRVALEQAVTIVGTELLRVRGIERVEERAKGNFVHALLHARFSNRADMVARAAHYDFDIHGRYSVVVAHCRALLAQRDSQGKATELVREATRVLEEPGRLTMATVIGDVVAVVRQLPPAGRQHDAGLVDVRAYAQALEQRVSERMRSQATVAFGRPVEGADAINDSYREARIALDLRQRLYVDGVCGFGDLRVHSLLFDLAQQPSGQEYGNDVLGPLRSHRDTALEDIARVYVDCGGNLNEAARRLNVHRNTMLSKIDRIERLLQCDMRSADQQFGLWLAFRLHDLAETAKRVDHVLIAGG